MAGSRMLTAEVLALTTNVDRQVAARTPLTLAVAAVELVIGPQLSPGLGQQLEQQGLGDDELLDLRGVDTLVGRVDPGERCVLRAPEDELGLRRDLLQGAQQRDRPARTCFSHRLAEGLLQRGACGVVAGPRGLAAEGRRLLRALHSHLRAPWSVGLEVGDQGV